MADSVQLEFSFDRKRLSVERLKELLDYDPETGVFTWKVKRNSFAGKVRPGAVAGRRHIAGYWAIGIERQLYLAHRLAWLWMTGDWPPSEIDHKNGDRGDTRWENLRVATSSENKGNMGIPKHNTSGLKGASWDKKKRRWRAQIQHDGRNRFIGYFDTIEEAHAAYMAEAEKAFGAFARSK